MTYWMAQLLDWYTSYPKTGLEHQVLRMKVESYRDFTNCFRTFLKNNIALFLFLKADKSRGWSNWGNWGPCDKKCTRERERFCSAKKLEKCPGATKRYRIQLQKGKCAFKECYGEF